MLTVLRVTGWGWVEYFESFNSFDGVFWVFESLNSFGGGCLWCLDSFESFQGVFCVFGQF